MTRFIALLLAAASTPALAQHQGHDTLQGHGQVPQPPVDPHAGHQVAPPPEPDPHAGHQMPAPPTADPHAGHRMPAEPQADPHAGHDMGARVAAPPVAPPPPGALSGPAHAADDVFGAERMAPVREAVRAEHGDMRTSRVSIDRLEARIGEGRDGFAWDGIGFWYGTPLDKLVVESEGEGEFGDGIERAEVQVLWSHALNPWFDVQAGVRTDFQPGPDRAWLALGIQGLAPYWFEVDATAYVSNEGEVTARVEAEYDLRLTQSLILQPAAEIELSLQDAPEIGLGSGLSSVEAGLRLRYEIVPEFAPYVGVQYERAFGDTARFARAAGEDAGGWAFVFGIRSWF